MVLIEIAYVTCPRQRKHLPKKDVLGPTDEQILGVNFSDSWVGVQKWGHHHHHKMWQPNEEHKNGDNTIITTTPKKHIINIEG